MRVGIMRGNRYRTRVNKSNDGAFVKSVIPAVKLVLGSKRGASLFVSGYTTVAKS